MDGTIIIRIAADSELPDSKRASLAERLEALLAEYGVAVIDYIAIDAEED